MRKVYGRTLNKVRSASKKKTSIFAYGLQDAKVFSKGPLLKGGVGRRYKAKKDYYARINRIVETDNECASMEGFVVTI